MLTTLISTDELAARLDDPSLALFDVRHELMSPESWGENEYKTSHIPRAVFLHIDRDLSAPKNGHNGRHPLPTPEACAALFSRVGIDAGKQVVVYDQGSGSFASRLWWMLRWLGHDAVAVLDGGFAKWMREGRPVTADVVAPMPTSFEVTHVTPTLNSVGVEASLSRHTLLLVDARAAERYRGDVERRTWPARRPWRIALERYLDPLLVSYRTSGWRSCRQCRQVPTRSSRSRHEDQECLPCVRTPKVEVRVYQVRIQHHKRPRLDYVRRVRYVYREHARHVSNDVRSSRHKLRELEARS